MCILLSAVGREMDAIRVAPAQLLMIERNAEIHFMSWLFGYKHINQTAQIKGVIHGLPMNNSQRLLFL